MEVKMKTPKFKKKSVFLIKTYSTVICLLLVVCFLAACEKPKNPPNGGENNDTLETTLQGTSWKAVGIFDGQADTLIKELEPQDCEECYTLIFNADSTAIAYSINMTLKLDLLNLGLPDSVVLTSELICERYSKDGQDYCDSHVFRTAIIISESYIITANELKLFYTYMNENRYLLFNLLK